MKMKSGDSVSFKIGVYALAAIYSSGAQAVYIDSADDLIHTSVYFSRGKWIYDTAKCGNDTAADFINAQCKDPASDLNREMQAFLGVIPHSDLHIDGDVFS